MLIEHMAISTIIAIRYPTTITQNHRHKRWLLLEPCGD